ncbi:hypothetical protein U1Q18_041845 [Sarracenia purpurea var. burkii]
MAPLIYQNIPKFILHPQILPNIGLVKHNNPVGVHFPTILSRLRCNPESQRHVRHGKHHYPIIRNNVLRNPPQPSFQNVVFVQKTHLRGGFEPYLVLPVGRQEIEPLDSKAKTISLGEIPDLGSHGNQLVSLDVGGSPDKGFADVEDSVLLQSEAVVTRVGFGAFVRWILDDVLQVVACEFEYLLENLCRLVLVQCPHRY